MTPRTPTRLYLLTTAASLTMTGCRNDDDRMWHLSREVAEASRELVAADADARRELIEASRELQQERQSLDRQHERLEEERRAIAAQRHRDPIIANALLTTSLVLAALLPLTVAYLLLKHQLSSSDDTQLAELLLADMTASTPVLYPLASEHCRSPGLEHGNIHRLTSQPSSAMPPDDD